MALLSIKQLEYSLGTRRLLDRVDLTVDAGERVCLIGRNGEGKSTLLNIIAGRLQADDGEIVWADASHAALVGQAPTFDAAADGHDVTATRATDTDGNADAHALAGDPLTVFGAVASGLGDVAALVNAWHDASRRLGQPADEAAGDESALAELERLQQRLEAVDGWRLAQRVEQIVSRLNLPADARIAELSGGWQRRVALGRALVRQPTLLLLDEPTNHLDIDAIEWLENFLLGYAGAVLFITHDRRLLERAATRILELDRGRLTSWPGDYANYLRRVEEREHAEAKQNAEFDKKLAQEEAWIRQGIRARRTRNEGRVRALKALREQRRARVDRQGGATMPLGSDERSGQLVIEAKGLCKRYRGNPVVEDFSCRIQRGDRIGLLGPNGAGKTTLLRLLLGRLEPDAGSVRLGSKLQPAYFDQHRAQLDDTRTALDNVADGADRVRVNGRDVHVITYLQKFLFDPQRARSQVGSLSGGERNRLLLARLFARPVNLLVMDEPTNDLDLETLEVLEELLVEFDGTLLLVSHDRAFIDNVVTATLAFEGRGRIRAYAGGYSDWLAQRPPPASQTPAKLAPGSPTKPRPQRHDGAAAGGDGAAAPRKLSYNEQRELQQLPARIETLEAELEALQRQVGDSDFYQRDPAEIKTALARLQRLEDELADAYGRWEALEG